MANDSEFVPSLVNSQGLRIVIPILLAFSCLSSALHPIYLSLCIIEISNEPQWTGTFNLFFDDLEDALQNQEGKRPNLISDNLEQNRDALQKYLSEHFHIKGEEYLTYKISHLERKNDLILVQIEGDRLWPASSTQISNTLLLELFEAQKNIVKIRSKSTEQLLYFKKNNTVLHHSE